MNGFAEFISANTSGRIDCVNRQIETYSSTYRPGAGFYKDFCDALIAGRKAGTDELTLQRCVSAQRVDARRRHYIDLRQHWLNMRTWHLEHVKVGRAAWQSPSLTVNVSPELGLRLPDGRVAVAKLWLREPEPGFDAVRAMQRLLAMQMDAIYAGGVPLVIDIRRERAHLLGNRRFKRGFDDMLRSEALSMGDLWTRLAKSA